MSKFNINFDNIICKQMLIKYFTFPYTIYYNTMLTITNLKSNPFEFIITSYW